MAVKNNDSVSISEEFAMKVSHERKKANIIRTAPIIILVALSAFFSCFDIGFFSLANLGAILNQLAIPLIISLGLTFVILLGSIDLSVDGMVGLAGSLVSLMVLNGTNNNDFGVWGIAIAIMIGTAAGALVGIVHVKTKIPSFMVTFGMSSIASGIALLSYQGVPVQIKEPFFDKIAQNAFLSIPILTWIALGVLVIAYILQEYTCFGRYVYAIGTNESIPRQTGVNVDKIKILVFTWCGFCLAIAGVLGAMRLGRGEVAIGTGKLFPSITAVVLGGTELSGGKGGVQNTLIGALITTVLTNGLILLGVDPYVQTGILGIIIVAVVACSIMRKHKMIIK